MSLCEFHNPSAPAVCRSPNCMRKLVIGSVCFVFVGWLAGLHLLARNLLLYLRAFSAASAAQKRAQEYAAAHHLSTPATTLKNTTYATLVYGQESTSVCEAIVLGSAIAELDPGKYRSAVVHNLSKVGHAELATMWTLFDLGGLQGGGGESKAVRRSKSQLWRLPFGRVLFLDADHVPVLDGNLTSRRRRFEYLWRQDAELVAPWELPHPYLSSVRSHSQSGKTPCFNSGAMLLKPNAATARRIEHGENMMRQAQLKGYTVGERGQESTMAPEFARCPQGIDQPPLNWALPEFATLPLVQLSPITPCLAGGALAEGDTFHAFTGLSPLRLGSSCDMRAVLHGKARCEIPAHAAAHRVFRTFGCAKVMHEFGLMWWRQFRKLPKHTQDYCLQGQRNMQIRHRITSRKVKR